MWREVGCWPGLLHLFLPRLKTESGERKEGVERERKRERGLRERGLREREG